MNTGYRFAFRSFDEEIEARVRSDRVPIEGLAEDLLKLLVLRGISDSDLNRLAALIAALRNVDFDRVYLGYFRHPLRLALNFCRDLPDPPRYEAIALALCHNVRELAVPGLPAICREFLSDPEIVSSLDSLETDRSRERDSEYLNTFYDAIAAAPLEALRLKGFDKLDNLLIFGFKDFDRYHTDVITDFLVPRLASIAPRLVPRIIPE